MIFIFLSFNNKEIFDSSIHETTDFLENGKTTIGGIEFEIDMTEGFDIVIPELNAIYTNNKYAWVRLFFNCRRGCWRGRNHQ